MTERYLHYNVAALNMDQNLISFAWNLSLHTSPSEKDHQDEDK